MKKTSPTLLLILIALSFVQSGCGGSPPVSTQASSEEASSVGALDLPDFSTWSAAQVCQELSSEVVADALGRKLVNEPQPFDDPTTLGIGCAYDAGSDGQQAYFAYLSLAPGSSYEQTQQAGSEEIKVDDFGLEAFRLYGADAEQLWIKLSDEAALVVAIGDRPNLDAARLLAKSFLESVTGEK